MLTLRNIILIDIAGAFLTSLTILVLFASNLLSTGLPGWVLICLGIAAALLGSFGAYRLATSSDHLTTLGILAFVNFGFCILSGALWWNNLQRLTLLGRLYFPAEIFVITILALFELRCTLRGKTNGKMHKDFVQR